MLIIVLKSLLRFSNIFKSVFKRQYMLRNHWKNFEEINSKPTLLLRYFRKDITH